MYIFLGVSSSNVSHDLVRYNGSENCSSTTGLLCSSPNLASSLDSLFLPFSLSVLSLRGCDLWPCLLAKGPSLGSVTSFHERRVHLSRKGKTNVDSQSMIEKWEKPQRCVPHGNRNTTIRCSKCITRCRITSVTRVENNFTF